MGGAREEKTAAGSLDRHRSSSSCFDHCRGLAAMDKPVARSAGLVLPGFLTASWPGRDHQADDAMGARDRLQPIERGWRNCSRAFLVMYLMSLKLVVARGGGRSVNDQTCDASRNHRNDRHLHSLSWLGAILSGGHGRRFSGFGLSSMPVAMADDGQCYATLRSIAKSVSDHCLAGSFFVDLATPSSSKAS